MQRKQNKGGPPASGRSIGGKGRSKQVPKCMSKGAAHVKDPMPAFSKPLPPPTGQEQQKAKQKIIRRNKPAGEDLKKLKDIVKNLGEKLISVQEFIGLVAPSTEDNGAALRTILAEELANFRTVSKKIYETMTQDISDVLTNEHIQLKEFSEERCKLLEDKMHKHLNEIFTMCPDFDFDVFFTKEGYLDEMLPLAPELDMDSEEVEALMRQEAYHRYQWLKSEGERLKEENTRLQKRLAQLKKQQKAELNSVAEREQRAEEARQHLEAQQEQLEDKLDELNESVGKTLVESELAKADAISLDPIPPKPKITDKFKQRKKMKPKPDWAAQQAAEMEASKTTEALEAETSKISLRAKTSMSRTAIKKKTKRLPSRRPPTGGDSSPFHYSPSKSPPPGESGGGRQTSPFHYSPSKSPQGAAGATSPFHYTPNRTDYGQFQTDIRGGQAIGGGAAATSTAEPPPRTRVTTSRTVTEQQPAKWGKSHQAPKDTWGGF